MEAQPIEIAPEHDFLFNAYDCYCGQGSHYISTHYKRYKETLNIIPEGSRMKILELGASNPMAFSLMLMQRFPDAQLCISQSGELKQVANNIKLPTSSDTFTIGSSKPDFSNVVLPIKYFNVEVDSWNYEDNSFDIVLCMEMLEHLLLDPFFVFKEANRVLKKDGCFILTTPNISCHESLTNLLQGNSPYTFGVYSSHGEYGRHNREYVPSEIDILGKMAGFNTEIITTKDVYPFKNDISLSQGILSSLEADFSLRGQCIFYCGKKIVKEFEAYPDFLYDFNPDVHSVLIEIVEYKQVKHNEMSFNLCIINTGQYTWENSYENSTRLGVMLLDENKNILNRDFHRIDFEKNVNVGETVELNINVPLPDVVAEYIFRFDIVHEHVCWFGDVTKDKSFKDFHISAAVYQDFNASK